MPRMTRSQTAALRQKAAEEEEPQQQREPFVEVNANIAAEPTKPAPKARATRSKAKKPQKENSDPEPEPQSEPPAPKATRSSRKTTVDTAVQTISPAKPKPATRTRTTRQTAASSKTAIEPESTTGKQDASPIAKSKSPVRGRAVRQTLPSSEAVSKPAPEPTTSTKTASTETVQETLFLLRPVAPTIDFQETRQSRAAPSVLNKKPPVVATTRTALLRAQKATGKSIDIPPSRPSLQPVTRDKSPANASSQPTQKAESPKKTTASRLVAKESQQPLPRTEEQPKVTAARRQTAPITTEAKSPLRQSPRRKPESPKVATPRLAPDSRIHKLAEPKPLPSPRRIVPTAAAQQAADVIKPSSIRHTLSKFESPQKIAPPEASVTPQKEHAHDARARQTVGIVESPLLKLSTPKRHPTAPSITPSKHGVHSTVARLQAAISVPSEAPSPKSTPQKRQTIAAASSPRKEDVQTPRSRQTITSTQSPFSRLATPKRPATGVSINPIKESTPTAKPTQNPISTQSPALKQTPKRPSYLPSPVKSNKPITTPVPFRFNAIGRDTTKESPKPAPPMQPVTPKQPTAIPRYSTPAQRPSVATPKSSAPAPAQSTTTTPKVVASALRRPTITTPKLAAPAIRQAAVTPKLASPAIRQAAVTPKLASPAMRQSAVTLKLASPAIKQSAPAARQPTTPSSSMARPSIKDRIKSFETAKPKPSPTFVDARTLLRTARKDARKGAVQELTGEVEYADLLGDKSPVKHTPVDSPDLPIWALLNGDDQVPIVAPTPEMAANCSAINNRAPLQIPKLVSPVKPPTTRIPRTPPVRAIPKCFEASPAELSKAPPLDIGFALLATDVTPFDFTQVKPAVRPAVKPSLPPSPMKVPLAQIVAEEKLENMKRAKDRAEAAIRGHQAVLNWATNARPKQ
ncbi:hypothetical protein Dda_4599 [Drechslerella dactyloides]|uniref:Uncharacterized protein n=1 Tax=Drechslerella dactyloides TaxID=74499 RepID=A0AAD6IX85_DREDA|nr:hypothetical protein Dda_4599 [Drechslerella dactyloides]